MAEMHLIVGLGNPGNKYQHTRHNVGWRVLEELVLRYELGSGRTEKRALTWNGQIAGQRVKLVKPMTFMNRSGEAIRPLLDYYQLSIDDLLVIHDDLDTPFGIIKLRKSGGHGGQNGLRSVIQHVSSKDFARLRFGIGRPPGKMQAVDYVLQPFKGDDDELAEELTRRSADAVETWLREGIESAMSAFNGDAERVMQEKSAIDLNEKHKILLRAHELAPTDPMPLAKLIAIQKKLGKLDEAVENHLLLARIHEQAGEHPAAWGERVKAVTIRPDLVDLQRELAEWYRLNHNSKKAVSRYLILAEYFRQQNDIVAAKATVETALALNPQHPKAQEMQRQLLEIAAN